MGRYVLRRVPQPIPVIFFSTFIVFMVIHLDPGDAAAVLAGPNTTPEALAAIRKSMGLDQPLLVQYVLWFAHVLQGDLGNSTLSGQPIVKLLAAGATATIELTLAAMTISMLVALPLAILSATHVRGRIEWVVSTIQSLWLAIPNFWAGILAIIIFSLVLVYGHALRNAMFPVITILGVQFASLLGGTVIIESVFSWPGVGGLMLDGISNRDHAVVQARLLLLVILFIIIKLLVDLTYALINPRIRFGDT